VAVCLKKCAIPLAVSRTIGIGMMRMMDIPFPCISHGIPIAISLGPIGKMGGYPLVNIQKTSKNDGQSQFFMGKYG